MEPEVSPVFPDDLVTLDPEENLAVLAGPVTEESPDPPEVGASPVLLEPPDFPDVAVRGENLDELERLDTPCLDPEVPPVRMDPPDLPDFPELLEHLVCPVRGEVRGDPV